MQNKGHIKVLKEILTEYPNVPYHNIVVFSGRAKLKITVTSDVISASQLLSTIQNHNEVTLTPIQVQSICESISSSSLHGRHSRRDHVDTIQRYLRIKALKVAELICPRCEGELVERKGKYGTFLGCANYPKCRYVVKEKQIPVTQKR